MKERPLLMSGPLVLATLADRKTQTRRLPRPGGYGQPGDRLWVRETWAIATGAPEDPACAVRYRADGLIEPYTVPGVAKTYGAMRSTSDCWRPSIHMPRWASRLTLEILEVRTEPLQAITEEDAKAEGLPWNEQFGMYCGPHDSSPSFGLARLAFKSWWIHLHGAKSWSSNPEVTVITFKRVTP